MNDTIKKALEWRYATQVYDPEKKVSEVDLHTILEAGRLAPSSFGFEAWKFIVIEDPAVRQKLLEVGYGQPKILNASHLVVVAYKTDIKGYIVKDRIDRVAKVQNQSVESLGQMKQMLDMNITKRSDTELDTWIKAQAYIPLGVMITAASLLHIDTGPMEGFDAAKVDEVLGLQKKNLHSTYMLALGYRGDDPAALRPKVRQTFEEVIEFVK